jgi:hypothetical protein
MDTRQNQLEYFRYRAKLDLLGVIVLCLFILILGGGIYMFLYLSTGWGVVVSLIGIMPLWFMYRDSSTSYMVHDNGLEFVNSITGRKRLLLRSDIGEVGFMGWGEDDPEDYDFCNHIQFKNHRGKVIFDIEDTLLRFDEFLELIVQKFPEKIDQQQLEWIRKRRSLVEPS